MSAVSFSYDRLNMMINIAQYIGSASGALDAYCSDLMNGLFHPLNNLSACEPYGNSHVSNAGCNVQSKINVLNDNANYWNAMANSLQSYLAFMQSQDEQVAHLFNDVAASYLPPVLRNFYGLTAKESLEYIIEQFRSFPEYAELLANFLGLDKAKEFVLRFFSSEKLGKANLGPRDLNMYRHPQDSGFHLTPSMILMTCFWPEHRDTAEVFDRYTEMLFSDTFPRMARDCYEPNLHALQNLAETGQSYLEYWGNYNLENLSTTWNTLEILDDARHNVDQAFREDWGHPIEAISDYWDICSDTWDDLSDLYSESYDNISDMRYEIHHQIFDSLLDSASTDWDNGLDFFMAASEWRLGMVNDLADIDHPVFSIGASFSLANLDFHTTSGSFSFVFDPIAFYTDRTHCLAVQCTTCDGDSLGAGADASLFFSETLATGISDTEGVSTDYGAGGGGGTNISLDFSYSEDEDGGYNWPDAITLAVGPGAGAEIHQTTSVTEWTVYPGELIDYLFN